jgi:hypothetical protein
MFWCVPHKDTTNNTIWKVEYFDSDGDDLSNWLIILNMMSKSWDIDFESCKKCTKALPRGLISNGIIYHGNNLPSSISLSDILKGSKIKNCKPKYCKKLGINHDNLSTMEKVLGRELNLEYTE